MLSLSTRASFLAGLPVHDELADLRNHPQPLLDYYQELRKQHGDVVAVAHRHLRWLQVTHPDDLAPIFKRSHREFSKGWRWDNFRKLAGDGLITVEPQRWLERRREWQPSFLRAYHERFATHIAQGVDETIQRWRPFAKSGEVVPIAREMSYLTLATAGHTIFGVELADRVPLISEKLSSTLNYLQGWHLYPWHKRTFGVWLPRTAHARYARNMKALEAEVQRIIARRGERAFVDEIPIDEADLLGRLLQNEKTSASARDAIMTFLFTGHETTSIAVSWVWHLLGAHAWAQEQLHAELESVLGGESPTRADLPRLPFLRQLVSEALRLYPPVWMFLRETTQPETIGGHAVPANTTLNIMPFLVHRHPEFWPDAERFDPHRFAPEQEAARHPCAYIPFGHGPRQCLGKHTALLETQLIVAGLAQKFVLRPVAGVEVRPKPGLTLWPSEFLPMTIHAR